MAVRVIEEDTDLDEVVAQGAGFVIDAGHLVIVSGDQYPVAAYAPGAWESAGLYDGPTAGEYRA
jgi:hypothetical protein